MKMRYVIIFEIGNCISTITLFNESEFEDLKKDISCVKKVIKSYIYSCVDAKINVDSYYYKDVIRVLRNYDNYNNDLIDREVEWADSLSSDEINTVCEFDELMPAPIEFEENNIVSVTVYKLEDTPIPLL